MSDHNFWLKIKKPILALAPMAGFSDSAFRQITSAYGADVVYSEMASVTALFYNKQATLDLLRFNKKKEKNYVVQLFGSNPEHFAVAAKIVTEEIKPSGIDINFGCPVGKVIKQGAGAELMSNLTQAHAVVAAVCANTKLPISVKIRAKSGQVSALDFLKAISDLPVVVVMIHGRSVKQGFSGEIDYNLIKEARQYFSGIILANGGINNLTEAKKTLELSQADGLGLARGVLGRPWLFREIKKNKVTDLDIKAVAKIILHQAKMVERLKGQGAIIELRKHLCWYVQGLNGASAYRSQLVKAESYQDIKNIFKF
ncbi:MAG: tRNA-dihydrouridine synthase [Candidatus Falkowbacteria bacterium]